MAAQTLTDLASRLSGETVLTCTLHEDGSLTVVTRESGVRRFPAQQVQAARRKTARSAPAAAPDSQDGST